jgi:hypothetical protein
MEIKFFCSQQDFSRASRRHCREKWDLPRTLPGLAISLVVGVWLWKDNAPNLLAFASLGFTAIFVLLLVITLYISPWMQYRSSESWKRSHHFRFSESSIDYTSGHRIAQCNWETYTQLLVDQHSYLLYFENDRYTLIPKRVFPDLETRQQFEQLIRKKIPVIIDR